MLRLAVITHEGLDCYLNLGLHATATHQTSPDLVDEAGCQACVVMWALWSTAPKCLTDTFSAVHTRSVFWHRCQVRTCALSRMPAIDHSSLANVSVARVHHCAYGEAWHTFRQYMWGAATCESVLVVGMPYVGYQVQLAVSLLPLAPALFCVHSAVRRWVPAQQLRRLVSLAVCPSQPACSLLCEASAAVLVCCSLVVTYCPNNNHVIWSWFTRRASNSR